MKPERWQQLDQLFHLALELEPAHRTAFLAEACVDDVLLRKEVEELLAGHEEAGTFMDRPALEFEAQSLAKDQDQSVVGQIIGHYKIISSIGAGGMGEVYLAQDTHLGRRVALKLLPAQFTQDTDRERRFQQEARAASALNHPNIITIHEIGQAGKRHFIATEFIDGETLRKHLSAHQSAGDFSATGINQSEALSIALQVADALAAAHARGIVHRDIKPENIILVRDSHLQQKGSFVKLLDFGIAKLTEQTTGAESDATTRVLLNTHEGSVIGTAAYMSPEQARGERVDGRTDIWSLGIVLYEMLGSGVPFGGDTAQDVIASILKEEPPPLPVEISDRLRWIVEKALRKDKEERYQTAREMFSDLRDLREHESKLKLINEQALTTAPVRSDQTRVAIDQESAALKTNTATRPTSEAVLSGVRRYRATLIIASIALVILVGGIGLYKFGQKLFQPTKQDQVKSGIPFQTMKMLRLTSTGKVMDAAISPDGKYVVHVVADGNQESLWMTQVSSPTSGVPIKGPDDLSYQGVTYSPNGEDLYINAWDRKNPFALYQMSNLGGIARKLVSDIDSHPTFSPDGKQFAFLRGNPKRGERSVFVVNSDGTAERKVATRKIPARRSFDGPAWSPDGKVIVYPVDSPDPTDSYFTLAEVQLADLSEKPITSQRWSWIERLVWLHDGSGLIFIAKEQVASPFQIWYLSYPGGQVHRITNDLSDYLSLSLSADSASLVTVKSEQVSNIWIAPNANARRASQITNNKFDGVEGISWTPDGKIVYASRAGDTLDLWMVEPNGTGQKQLTANAGNNKRPSVSLDGRYIVFVSDRTGTDHIWRINIDGSDARQLTNGRGEKNPQCSPNGEWVVYQLTSGRTGVWRVPIDGGESKHLVDQPTRGIAISPDNRWIASSFFEDNAIKTAIYPFEGGEPEKVLDINSNYVRWTLDGRALAYVDQRGNQNVISSQSIDGGPAKPLIDFSPDRIFFFAWSLDGKQLAVARGTVTQDVVLISNFKDH